MAHFPLDDLDRTRMHWPEPMLIDLIATSYGTRPVADRIFVARLQARFLKELVDGNLRQAAFLRLELIAACAARGIPVGEIESADEAVFDELARTAATRFRNSPKVRAQTLQRLGDARMRLPAHKGPPPASVPIVRALDAARTSLARPMFRPAHKIAANG